MGEISFLKECPICMDDFQKPDDEFREDVKTNCGHYFHLDCILKWTEENNTCPLCR